MPLLLLDGMASTGTVVLPRLGLAVARLEVPVSRSDPLPWQPGQQLPLVLEADGRVMTWRVTVCSLGPELGLVSVVCVGGRARMDTVLQPRYYLSPDAGLVFRDLVSEAGEEPEVGPGMDKPMPRWVRLRHAAADALWALLEWLGPNYAWRATPEGRIWCGKETYPRYLGADRLIYELDDPGSARAVVNLSPDIAPGMMLEDSVVDRVVHYVAPERQRTELWLATRG